PSISAAKAPCGRAERMWSSAAYVAARELPNVAAVDPILQLPYPATTQGEAIPGTDGMSVTSRYQIKGISLRLVGGQRVPQGGSAQVSGDEAALPHGIHTGPRKIVIFDRGDVASCKDVRMGNRL